MMSLDFWRGGFSGALGFIPGARDISDRKVFHVSVVSEHSSDGEEVTVSVAGRFDYRIYDSFKASFDEIDEDRKTVNVDLSETDYMDSSALGMLLMLREHVGRAAKVCLLKPSPDVMRVLTIANFDKLFSIRT